ncbi:MAG TPA: leucyl/phenylalanyl-tRNA--protein transferase [Luteibacter sp.]|jgi:leucyl/phenylalanyl-tRNA--protein transferase|nr:leucyl/phenylalanyl-tRNA--protein transferase [Luteibacter sp.]
MIHLPRLHAAITDRFPDPADALDEPNGLLAYGGDLSPDRLLAAYARGIFPWFNADEPILWWSPDPRCVFLTDRVHVGRRLARQLRQVPWTLTVDRAFADVMRACAAPREGQPGTWISKEIIDAYDALHRRGHAHSVEVWEAGELVGGIYGVAIGRLFCGESMFSRRNGASKAALVGLSGLLHRWGFPLLDAQVTNGHLLSLGAIEIPRAAFLESVGVLAHAAAPDTGAWRDAEVSLQL